MDLQKTINIAIFMGAKVTKVYSDDPKLVPGQDGYLFYFQENSPGLYRNMSSAGTKYHSSWDWLMGVYKKFANLTLKPAHTNLQMNYCAEFLHGVACSDVNLCYKIMANAIEWYNTINKK